MCNEKSYVVELTSIGKPQSALYRIVQLSHVYYAMINVFYIYNYVSLYLSPVLNDCTVSCPCVSIYTRGCMESMFFSVFCFMNCFYIYQIKYYQIRNITGTEEKGWILKL